MPATSAPPLSLNQAALSYLEYGWSVIPTRGKQPAVSSWKKYQIQAPSKEQVTQWFSTLEPSPTGVAIITGRVSQLVVVDCDTTAAAELWTARFSASPLITKTGRGGIHIYYRTPADTVRNRVNIGGHRIDIRGEGGYVVAPPSNHENGANYTWCAEAINSDVELPIFELSWLVSLDHAPSGSMPSVEPATLRNVAAYIARIYAVAGRGGHSSTFRAACKLRDAGLSSDDALVLLTRWNETNAEPSWSAAELAHKIKSAYQVRNGPASD